MANDTRNIDTIVSNQKGDAEYTPGVVIGGGLATASSVAATSTTRAQAGLDASGKLSGRGRHYSPNGILTTGLPTLPWLNVTGASPEIAKRASKTLTYAGLSGGQAFVGSGAVVGDAANITQAVVSFVNATTADLNSSNGFNSAKDTFVAGTSQTNVTATIDNTMNFNTTLTATDSTTMTAANVLAYLKTLKFNSSDTVAKTVSVMIQLFITAATGELVGGPKRYVDISIS